jgi:hypothetical protein
LWEYALDSGSFANSRIAVDAGTALLQLTLDKRDVDRAIAIAERSEAAYPKVTAIGYQLLAIFAEQEDGPAAAERWNERLAQLISQ